MTIIIDLIFGRVRLRKLVAICLVVIHAPLFAQLGNDTKWLAQFNLNQSLPPKLLASRSLVFYSYQIPERDLNQVQDYLARTGIDAVAYFALDELTAGRDVRKAFAEFIAKREISNLIIVEKRETDFRIIITTPNKKENVIDPGQPAWSIENRLLLEALKSLNRLALAELKKENLLISTAPEMDLIINPIVGKRNEFYAVDMKVDLVAVQKSGDETTDQELASIFQENFPFQYRMVEPGLTEKELRKQGMLYIACFVHTRAIVAQDLLGYKVNPIETAIASVTFPDLQPQLKTIPSNTPVYKFYFKHIDSGNIFLGTKWDADVTWQSALLNNIRGMKAELRLN